MPDDPVARLAWGALPTGHQLRSALRAGRVIAEGGSLLVDARASYGLVPYGGIYRSEDLAVGEQVLIAAGLLREVDGMFIPRRGLHDIAHASDTDGCEALLAAFLASRPPLWLLAATAEGIVIDELIPDEAHDTLQDVMDTAARDALLLAMGRRFSDEARSVTGNIAEDFVEDRCREELRAAGAPILAEAVRRMSEYSDQLGYDISAPRLDGSTRRIEVKGTRSGGEAIVIFISRNEAERGLRDRNWSLVSCRVAGDDSVELVGHLAGPALKCYLPLDPHPEGRWQSARIELPAELFAPGLPAT